jgi:hypothetical protein
MQSREKHEYMQLQLRILLEEGKMLRMPFVSQTHETAAGVFFSG